MGSYFPALMLSVHFQSFDIIKLYASSPAVLFRNYRLTSLAVQFVISASFRSCQRRGVFCSAVRLIVPRLPVGALVA